jgi:isopenicillin-N N-acyltransferase-like protein
MTERHPLEHPFQSFGPVPVVRVKGTAFDCGRQLGERWSPELRARSKQPEAGSVPVLRNRLIVRLFERHAPALLDLHRGLAKGAGIPEEQLFSVFSAGPGQAEGCTSFAVHPRHTLSGSPLSGQTKDTGRERIDQFLVLALRTTEGFDMLTLTYPGWLFGHGFVSGGCSIFRNSISCGNPGGKLPYDAWGLLVHACPTVEDARKLTLDHGVLDGFHCAIADEHGGILGLEAGKPGYAFLPPVNGLYSHTNHVMSGPPLTDVEAPPIYGLDGSIHRQKRLFERLEAESGRLTGLSAFAALGDHTNYPNSICSDARANGGMTTSGVVVEPLKRLMHVSRGLPCRNPAVTVSLEDVTP